MIKKLLATKVRPLRYSSGIYTVLPSNTATLYTEILGIIL